MTSAHHLDLDELIAFRYVVEKIISHTFDGVSGIPGLNCGTEG